jgi:hypothetical protein
MGGNALKEVLEVFLKEKWFVLREEDDAHEWLS